MMRLIFTFAIIAGCFYILFATRWIWTINRAWSKGLFSTKKKRTMFDVRRLLLAGEKDTAIYIYKELFGVDHKEALKAINELERSIQEKNLES